MDITEEIIRYTDQNEINERIKCAYKETILNDENTFTRIIKAVKDMFFSKKYMSAKFLKAFLHYMGGLWEIIYNNNKEIEGKVYYYEFFRFYYEFFEFPYEFSVRILKENFKSNDIILQLYEDICHNIELVQLFYSQSYPKSNDFEIKISTSILSKAIAYDLVHRKENTIFDKDFYAKYMIRTRNRIKIYQLTIIELFKIYYSFKNTVKKYENIKNFMEKLWILFQKDDYQFFFLGKRKISVIIFNIIFEIYSVHNFNKNPKANCNTLSLYLHIQSYSLKKKSCPLNFLKDYETLFTLKLYEAGTTKDFSNYITELCSAFLRKQDENSVIHFLSIDVLNYLLTKLLNKDPKFDIFTWFFITEKFIVYLNFLYNYGNGVFRFIKDRTMKTFFFDKIFEILYRISQNHEWIAIMVINIGWQIYKNFRREEEIVVEKFILLVASCSIYYSKSIDFSFLVEELTAEKNFHTYFFKSKYFYSLIDPPLKEKLSKSKVKNQPISVQDNRKVFSLKKMIENNDVKSNLENFLSRIRLAKANELLVYLHCIEDLIEADGTISTKETELFKEVIDYFIFEKNISGHYYSYRNFDIPAIFYRIHKKLGFLINEKIVKIDTELPDLMSFYIYLTQPKKLNNRELGHEILYKLKDLFASRDSYFRQEFIEEIWDHNKTLELNRTTDVIMISLYMISQNIQTKNQSEDLIIKTINYIYRKELFQDEISMVICYFSLIFPKNSLEVSKNLIIDYFYALLKNNRSSFLRRFVSIYVYLDRSFKTNIEMIIKNLVKDVKCKDEVEMVFMKCLKHFEKKEKKRLKDRTNQILNINKIDERIFREYLKKAKIYFDLRVDFLQKIDFVTVSKNLLNSRLDQTNYYILEKVINMKNFFKIKISLDEQRLYINTLQSLENNEIFEECLIIAELYDKDERKFLQDMKLSINDYLLNINMKKYLSFLALPQQEISTKYFFILNMLRVVDSIISNSLQDAKVLLNTLTENFVCKSFIQNFYLNQVQEMNTLLEVLWKNNFNHTKDISSNMDIYNLFSSNKITENPDNLFRLQIRTVICHHLHYRELELNYILDILKIFKCRNDKVMVEKYLTLFQHLTSSTGNITYMYQKLKYLYFLGNNKEFQSIFNSIYKSVDLKNTKPESIWDTKIMLLKFQIEYNKKVPEDDNDHSGMIALIDQHKDIFEKHHESDKELEAKFYYIAGNFKALDNAEYSNIQSSLTDFRDKISIQNIQMCCKYFLLASIHTKKFKYLFKLLPKSIKLFKIIYDCNECSSSTKNIKAETERFIKEYSQLIRNLKVEKIAFIFQFLVDKCCELPFYYELVSKFTNKYPNYSIYSLISSYGSDDPNDSNILKVNEKKSFQTVWKKIKDYLENPVRKFLESAFKFLKILFKIKKLSDKERYNSVQKVIIQINELLSKEEVLLPKNIFDLIKFEGSEYNPSTVHKEFIHKILKEIEIYSSIMRPVKLIFEIKERDKIKRVPYIFKSEHEVYHEIVAAEFFECCSKILKLNQNTKYRNLNMSLYQIVKLDQESLLIEFIDNTTMLKSLINREWIKCGQNLDSRNIRQEDIQNKFEKWTSPDNLNFPNYFIDSFTDPQTFYQNKLNFIKTTAIWSISGYLIGLGDRHCQNILVKENSEVIHIDYGMILGRGKILPVPEIVQFRLTPNISQGLDIFQGKTLFYYYCYIILNALRKEKGSIFEMLETVYKVSNKTSDVQNLLSKLDKVSFCEVQDLLESSSDKEKLKKMYLGWCPWS